MFARFAVVALIMGSSMCWAADINGGQTIAERIAPIGSVCIEGKPCAAATAAAAEAATAASTPAAGAAHRSGQEIVQQVCSGCHGAGVMGAPRIGNKADWAPRIAKGMDTLLQHALNGFNNKMPPRGTCTSCSDDDIKAAITYMTNQSR